MSGKYDLTGYAAFWCVFMTDWPLWKCHRVWRANRLRKSCSFAWAGPDGCDWTRPEYYDVLLAVILITSYCFAWIGLRFFIVRVWSTLPDAFSATDGGDWSTRIHIKITCGFSNYPVVGAGWYHLIFWKRNRGLFVFFPRFIRRNRSKIIRTVPYNAKQGEDYSYEYGL